MFQKGQPQKGIATKAFDDAQDLAKTSFKRVSPKRGLQRSNSGPDAVVNAFRFQKGQPQKGIATRRMGQLRHIRHDKFQRSQPPQGDCNTNQ